MFDGEFIGGADLHSFLMIGQSNMAGRGEISDVAPINNFRCYMLRNGRFIRMREPINPDRPIFEGTFRSGISLAASFADEFARENQARVGLIPCADGGSSINMWLPGTIFYDHALLLTRLAMRTSTLTGILWHQGETDAAAGMSAEEYEEKLKTLISSLRRDLGSNLPFVMGEISDKITEAEAKKTAILEINRALINVAKTTHGCAIASVSDLTLKPDGLHFDSKSLRELGKRYYVAYASVK
ncbi:MAG: sialate O-acetylesterase [Clostridia bacterium]|nr:sialate O-acetylesterase [Clostridia bacterium]